MIFWLFQKNNMTSSEMVGPFLYFGLLSAQQRIMILPPFRIIIVDAQLLAGVGHIHEI